jgi:glycosyl transferase family 61
MDKFHERVLRYKDPLTFRHGSLADLTNSDDDVAYLSHPVAKYPSNTNFVRFVDQETPPVCPNLHIDKSYFFRPATFMYARSNVVMAGYRTVIGPDNFYSLDESFTSKDAEALKITCFSDPEQFNNELTQFTKAGGDSDYSLSLEDRILRQIDETAISLSSNEAVNYGSFLFRMLPKVADTRRLDESLKILIPLYLPTIVDFLELAGVKKDRLISQELEKIYFVRRLITISHRNRDYWLDQETLNFYDELRTKYGQIQSGRRLYLSRRDFMDKHKYHNRVMTNEDELLDAIQKRGFEVIEPQHYSAEEQIKLFSSASAIVSAAGSQMFNVVFSHPGTKIIDIESEPGWAQGHMCLFASRGLEYGVFEGRPSDASFQQSHNPYSVDVPRLMKRIDEFMPR